MQGLLSLRLSQRTTFSTDGNALADFLPITEGECCKRQTVSASASDVLSGILVPVQHQPAVRTGMCSHGECLGNILAAPRTILAGVARANFDYDFDGSFSLVSQNLEECSPRSIGDDTSKMMIAKHPFDVEVLHVQCVEAANKSISDFVLEIFSCPLYSLMVKG